MHVSEVMTKPVVTIGLDESVRDIKEVFENTRIRHILVVDEGRLFGVVSERDLLKSMSPCLEDHLYTTRDLALLNQRVDQIVIRNPFSLNFNAGVHELINIFKNKRIGCIPIVDDNAVPVGIVTRSDIFRNFDKICAVYFDRED